MIGELLTIEIAALVAGGFSVTAVYSGGTTGEDTLDDRGKFPSLVEAAAEVPKIPLNVEIELGALFPR